MKEVKIFDTTLRDGEQSPGCSMNMSEKLEMAKQLDALNVDVIEAGFAIASPGDFTSVKEIARVVKHAEVASLARAKKEDIDAAYEAVKDAVKPRIHVFLATSDIHMEYKLKMTREQVLKTSYEQVKYAVSLCDNVEFSAEDATRSDWEFLAKVVERVIEAGAKVVNIPDTVGYTSPIEMAKLVTYLKNNVKNIDKICLSVHCHNDLGLGVANSLAAIEVGANQVECTINGIGERAGNAALEEIVMNLKTRADYYNAYTNIKTQEIYATSKLLSKITGIKTQPNKAVIGDNAFAHESGVHQHGVLANRATYEIMSPQDIGIPKNKIVLGKHSGKHALIERYKELGITLKDDEVNKIFEEFKHLADAKKTVTDHDLELLVHNKQFEIPEEYKLIYYLNTSSNSITNTSTIKIQTSEGQMKEGVAISSLGPIDAAYKAINLLLEKEFDLVDFNISSISSGTDSQGYVTVKIRDGGKTYNGHAVALDIIESAIKAYLAAINNMIYDNKILNGENNGK